MMIMLIISSEIPFNSRPHEEVDRLRSLCGFWAYSFNSRPHEEVDFSSMSFVEPFCLSIHDLTRRSTSVYNLVYRSSVLSIHDLTRRSTAEEITLLKL